MKNTEQKRNIKLGGFVLGGVIIFLVTVVYLGSQSNLFSKTFSVSAVFENVEGLQQGDNVWLSGVKIGTVKQVKIIAEDRVMVQLVLKDKQNEFIKDDATAFIGSDGLIGNKIVIIRPGSASGIIANGDTINSFSPTDTQELFNLAKDAGTNIQSITADLKQISARLNNGEGIIGELIQDGPISKDIRGLVGSLTAAGNDTRQITSELRATMNEVNNGDGLVNKLLSDTAYVATFENAMSNVEEVSEEAKQMATELSAVVEKMNDADNAVGVLLADTAFARNLQNTVENTEAASDKLDENMKALQSNFLFRRYFKKKEKAEKKD
ncbi:MAG: MlaD family protein [Cryomorphaceae bacterium]